MAGSSDQGFDVFVSYRSLDRARLKPVLDACERHRLKVWLDQEQIPPGAPFPEALARGIESSRALVVLISTADLGSHWVSQEVNLALAREKRVVPARLEPFDVRRLPGFLAMLQCVDLTGGAGQERELDRLCRSLQPEGAERAPSVATSQDEPPAAEDRYSRFLSHDLERKRTQVRRLKRRRLLPLAPLALAGAAVAAYWATTAGAPSLLGLVLVGLVGVEGLIWTTTESSLQRALHEQQQIEQLRDGLEACRGEQHTACGRLREKFWAIVERSTALS